MLNPWEIGSNFNEPLLREKLKSNPDLLFYWWRIFISFALTGTNALVPFKPATKHELILVEQAAHAMEMFALAHEYAHHRGLHGKTVFDLSKSHEEEHEADLFALKISEAVEQKQRFRWVKGVPLENPYLTTGAGAILLLGSIEVFRKCKDLLFTGRGFDTHPGFMERAGRIKEQFVLQPEKYEQAQDFCAAIENVLRVVMLELSPLFEQYPFEAMAKISPGDWEAESFRL